MDVGEIYLQARAILTSQQRATFEVVAHLSLVSPLAFSQLCGIGVECRQRISVFVGKCRHVVDEARRAVHLSARAARHIVCALGLSQHAETFL